MPVAPSKEQEPVKRRIDSDHNVANDKGNAVGRQKVEAGAPAKPADDSSIWKDIRNLLPDGKAGDAVVDYLKGEFSDPVSAALFLSSLTPWGFARKFGWKALKWAYKKFRKKWLKRGKPEKRVKGRKKKKRPCPKKPGRGNPTLMPTGVTTTDDPEFTIDGIIPLRIASTYYADLEKTGPLGRGRVCDFDATIERNEEGGFTYRDDDNTEINFPAPTPIPDGWVEGDLTRFAELMQGRRRSLLYREGGMVSHFDKCFDGIWRISRICDRNDNALTFERDENANISTITNVEGLRVHFTYGYDKLRSQVELEGVDGSRRLIMRYDYDDADNMTLVECPYSDIHQFVFNEQNQMVRSSRNQRYEGSYSYDRSGRRLESASNRGFPASRFEYDDQNKVTSYLPSGDPDRAEHFHYDESDNVTKEINALGHETRTEDNEEGFVSAEIDGEGNTDSYTYDGHGNLKTVTDAEGRSTFYLFSAESDLEMVIDNAGNAWEYDYDEFGNLVSTTDPLGHITEIKNTSVGLPASICRHDGLIEQFAYSGNYWLMEEMDYRGGHIRYGRDGFGRVVSIVDPDDQETRFVYEDQSGQDFYTPARTVRADGVETVNRGSEYGRTVEVIDGEGRRAVYQYDGLDNLIKVTDPQGGTLGFHYDDEFDLYAVENQVGRRWTFERDVAGRIVRETDFDDRTTEYEYDKADRLIESRQEDGRVFGYEWDKSNLLLKRQVQVPGHAGPLEENYEYDDRGLLIAASNASTFVELEYDAAGRLVAETNNGSRVESDFDCCGNRIARRMEGHSTSYVHDPMGALTGLAVNGYDLLQIARDKSGRSTKRLSGNGFVLEEGYNSVGQLIRQTAHSGPQASQHRSSRSAPAAMTGWSREFIWDRALAPSGISDSLWGSSRYETDQNGQIVRAVHGAGIAGRNLLGAADSQSAPDKLGNAAPFHAGQSGRGNGPETERFAYAPTMDVEGSRTTRNGLNGRRPESWSLSPGGRIQHAVGPYGERIIFTYDDSGRVTKRRAERDGFRPVEWEFTWDGFDRLIGVICPDGACWGYFHDPFGRRIEKRLLRPGENDRKRRGRANSLGTHFVWDGDVIAAEIPLVKPASGPGGGAGGGPGHVKDRAHAVYWHFEPESFVPLLRETSGDADRAPIAVVDPDTGIPPPRKPHVLHVITDHLGTPRELVDETGALHWAASYRLWGSIRSLWTSADNDNDPAVGGASPWEDGGGTGNPARDFGSPFAVATSGNAARDVTLKWGQGIDPATAMAAGTQPAEEAGLCPIRFQGQWEDEETGLYYNRFRTYDPLSAQYLSPDPIGINGGVRTNSYVERPGFEIDPLGLQNLNSNNAVGNFGLYRIYANGKIYKVGLADMNRVTGSSGLPTRLHQQLRKLRQCYGAANVDHKIKRLGRMTKKCAKRKENEAIAAETLKSGGKVPPGNSLSYGNGAKTGADPCLDGSYPKGAWVP